MKFMDWFGLLFPPLMFFAAVLPTLFIRRSPDPDLTEEEQSKKIRRWSILLWSVAAGSLAIHLLIYQFASRQFATHTWPFYFLIWFGFAMPLWRAKNPSTFSCWMNGPSGSSQRQASLKPRQPVVPLMAVVIGLVIWIFIAIATALLMTQRDDLVFPWWGLLIFTLCGLGFMVGFGFGSRMSSLQPEPLDANESPELKREYESLRRFLGWGFYWLGFFGMLGFVLPPLLLAWRAEDLLIPAIVIGAGGGTLIGIAGGVMGTIGGMKRSKINSMLHQATEGGAG